MRGHLTTRKLKYLVALILAGATAAVYWEVARHSFVNYDDPIYVTNNLEVHRGLTLENLAWAFKTTTFGNWIPLAWLTHILDYQLYGMNAGGHHLTSLAIHLLNTVLLFLLMSKLTGAVWKSGFVAALFALHPLNVESVAWVAERKNVLCTVFWILGIWAYTWYAEKPNWKRYLLTLGVFAMGLMAKSMVVTLPFVLLLLDFWPLGRIRVADQEGRDRGFHAGAEPADRGPGVVRLVIEKVPFLLLAIVDGLITIRLQIESESLATMRGFPMGVRIEGAIVSYAAYLEKMVWPAKLAVLYPHPKSYLPLVSVSVAAVVLVCISLAVVWGSRRYRYLGMGWLWFLGTLVPVIGIIQAGAQSMADRYAYIPLIGIFIMIVWGTADLVEHYGRARDPVIVGAVCVIFALVIVTRVQLSYWSDSLALWNHAQQVTENNYIAYNNLGEALMSRDDEKAAAPWFFKSVSVYPDLPNAQLNLGMILVHSNRIDEGIAHLSRAIELDSRSFDGYNKLGAALVRKGQVDDAIRCFETALKINPAFPDALANLGIEFENQGRLEEASALFERAIQCSLNPRMTTQVRLLFGDLLLKKGEPALAEGQYLEALKLTPDCAPALAALDNLKAGKQ